MRYPITQTKPQEPSFPRSPWECILGRSAAQLGYIYNLNHIKVIGLKLDTYGLSLTSIMALNMRYPITQTKPQEPRSHGLRGNAYWVALRHGYQAKTESSLYCNGLSIKSII